LELVKVELNFACFTLGKLFLPLLLEQETEAPENLFYKKYFEEFFVKQRDKVKDKIIWTFDLIEELERVPETYLKHIESTEGLFEIRVQQGSDIYRIFCFLTRAT